MPLYHSELPDGRILYSASSLGYCPGAMFLDRLGITGEPTPEWLQERYDAGTHNEPIIFQLLEQQKIWEVIPKEEWLEMGFQAGEYHEERGVDYSNQIRVEVGIGGRIVVRAHLDGLVRMINVPPPWDKRRLGEIRVAEVKAFGPSYWNGWKGKGLDAFPKYQWQITAQMKGAQVVMPDIPLLFIPGRKGTEGSTECVEVDAQVVDDPPVPWGTVVRKLLDIEKRVEAGGGVERIPACPKPLDYPCPFYTFHEPETVVQPDDAVTLELLDSLAEQYEKWRKVEKEGKEKKSAASKGLLDYFINSVGMPDDGVKMNPDPVRGNVWQIDLVEQGRTAPGLDEAAMKRDGIDVEKYRVEAKYIVRYPNVKRIKGKG